MRGGGSRNGICGGGLATEVGRVTGGIRLTAASGIGILFVSCSTAAQPAISPSGTDVVATAGTTKITLRQVDDLALQQPASSFGSLRLAQALYEARRMAIDSLVGDALIDQEAKARGIDRVALIDQEVSSKVAQPTDADV